MPAFSPRNYSPPLPERGRLPSVAAGNRFRQAQPTGGVNGYILSIFSLLLLAWLAVGCRAAPTTLSALSPLTPTAMAASPTAAAAIAHAPATVAAAAPSLPIQPPTLTPIPTATATATPRPTATLIPTATATPIGPCSQRNAGDDLFALVTHEYGLSRTSAPSDLTPLADFLGSDVTLGYPTQVRQIIVAPLVAMIQDMQAAGLKPVIISGYRSYAQQAIAYDKWLQKTEYAGILSAPPGHSEHQLGTTLDFGSPELPGIVGDPDIEFHTYFYLTSEGQWLANYAHQYGFTLSYPRDTLEITGFYFEPWHFRYVGVELASSLKNLGISFTEYALQNLPQPCIP